MTKNEDWMQNKWRPMMGWSYMVTCIADFVIFPVLWSVLQSVSNGQVNIQWQPITLQGAGLYHIAMGAVLGIAAYGRTQEKLGGANNGGIALPSNAGTTYTPPSAPVASAPMAAPSMANTAYTPAPGWGSTPVASNSWGSAPVQTGWGGKKAPPEAEFPLIS